MTLVNTVLGMVVDTETGRAALGNGGGGLSGPAASGGPAYSPRAAGEGGAVVALRRGPAVLESPCFTEARTWQNPSSNSRPWPSKR